MCKCGGQCHLEVGSVRVKGPCIAMIEVNICNIVEYK